MIDDIAPNRSCRYSQNMFRREGYRMNTSK